MSRWGTLAVLARTGPGVGHGHVMRQVALAERWSAGGHPVVIVTPTEVARHVVRSIADAGARHVLSDRRLRSDNHDLRSSAWVVLDGFDVAEQSDLLGPTAARVLLLDDHLRRDADGADLVLDQNLAVTTTRPVAAGTPAPLLVGPQFALIRRAVSGLAPHEVDDLATTVGVVLGGDPSAEARHLGDQLEREVRRRRADVRVVLRHAQDPRYCSWSDFLQESDVLVSGAGSTTWEALHLGLPVMLVGLAPDQLPVGEAVAASGAGQWCGALEQVDPPDLASKVVRLLDDLGERTHLARRGASLVDGRGAARVVAAMRAEQLVVRPVCQNDERMLWRWANDPEVRRRSFSSEPIAWEEHRRWFADGADSRRLHLMAEDDGGQLVGHVRFEQDDDGLEVSTSVAPDARAQGVGAPMLVAALREALARRGPQQLHAWVRPDHAASLEVFQTAGFRLAGHGERRGVAAVHLVAGDLDAD
jgi:spore coat polysaccharide biosynthesis predicted glycosyltransferase SpsG/L-amino acid N-acyltransferase YncA